MINQKLDKELTEAKINVEIYKKLIECAKKEKPTNYRDLGFGRHNIGKKLGDISRFELKKGRPPLSVLVGLKHKQNFPSSDFFRLMRELQVITPGESDKEGYVRLCKWCYHIH